MRPLHPCPDWPSLLPEVFIGEPPRRFKVESHRPHKQGWIFKLKGRRTRDDGCALTKQPFFLSKTLFKSGSGEFAYLTELKGFSVEIKDRSFMGRVEGFSSNGTEDYLEIKAEAGQPLLVPFVSDYIAGVDFSKRLIRLVLPSAFPGLADD